MEAVIACSDYIEGQEIPDAETFEGEWIPDSSP